MSAKEATLHREEPGRATVAHYDKLGTMQMVADGEEAARSVFVVLDGSLLSVYEGTKDVKPSKSISMIGVICREAESRLHKKPAFELNVPTTLTRQISVTELESRERLSFLVESKEELNAWMGLLFRATLDQGWPGDPREAVSRLEVSPQAPATSSAETPSLVFSGAPEQRAYFQFIPKLKETGVKHRYTLLYKKLLLCSFRFDFSNGHHAEEKTIKRDTLMELKEAAESIKGLFSDDRSLADAIRMISMNCFRVLPAKETPKGLESDDEFVFSDPQWPHLHLVYDFLSAIIGSTYIDQNVLKKVMDEKVLLNFIKLFDSEDRNEREVVKSIIHRIYGKLTHRRTILRSAIYNTMLEFVYETHAHNGVADMLDILASIINGFTVPIRDEHIATLTRTLIPLHKMTTLDTYHPQLTYCMTLFAKKDHKLALRILRGILKFWPVCCSEKELLLLSEMEGLFEYVDADSFKEIEPPFERRLLRCLRSHHFQVVEHALLLYQNSVLYRLLVEAQEVRARLLPLLFPTLIKNSTQHWSEGVRQLSQHVLSLYNDVDPETIERLMPQKVE